MTRFIVLPAFYVLISFIGLAHGQDWPTYMHDGFRSGVTDAQLELPLKGAWTFKALHPPAPAWGEPARQDFFHDHFDLRAVETYDRAFHAVANADTVYFASSSQSKVYALNAETGAVRWIFFAEGPIRFAPALSDGRLYVGSDDGCVYCLSGKDGALLWKRRVAPDERMIPGNGRMISLWPVRTGLVVDQGLVYCTAGLFPEQGTYLAALDARTGSVKYRQRLKVAPQGYILASAQRLYLPTGRTNPAIFSREQGNAEGQLPSAGGAYAVLTEDVLVTGPGRGPKRLQADDVQAKDTVATFGGLRMVVSSSVAYMQSEQQLAAFDRGRYLSLSRERTQLQRTRSTLQKSLKKMEAAEAEKARTQIEELNARIKQLDAKMKACYLWTTDCGYPYSLIVAGKTLFAGGDGEVAAVDSETGSVVWKGQVEGRAYGLSVAGRSLFVSTDGGRIHCFRRSGLGQWQAIVSEVRSNHGPQDDLSERYEKAADTIIQQISSRKGYCLVLDCGEGRLAYELARRTGLEIVAVESDAEKANKARRLLDAAGFSNRAVVHHHAGGKLPYTSYFANLVVSDGMLRGDPLPDGPRELLRVLRPCGGTLILGTPTEADADSEMQKWGQAISSDWHVTNDGDFTWGRFTRGSLDGSGEWTHIYAEPGNSACSGDRLVKGPLTPQWFGEPGPRDMIDRHHRNVPPLSRDGRLFVPGDNMIFGMDAYNGAILWRVDVPVSRRLGAFLDGGSMAVDEHALYLAAADRCHAYDVRDGQLRSSFTMPQLGNDETHEWGVVAYLDTILLGSGCKPVAPYRETSRAADEALWYRDMKLVTSDCLFAKDKRNDALLWTYRDGVVLNTTIVIAAGRIYFLETHSPQALADETGRMSVKTLFAGGEQYLVALEPDSGRTAFKKKIDVSHFEEPVYLNFGQGVLLLSGSRLVDKSIRYYYDAYDAQTGDELWHAEHDSGLAIDGGHGEYNRHPTIVGGIAYAWPYAYDLRTGKRVDDWKFDRRGHGCGGVSASAQCLFWRGLNPWMYDLGSQGGPTRLNSVTRPGCWINMIPAGGLLLIPEASSGCTCGFSMQTSLAYIPESSLR